MRSTLIATLLFATRWLLTPFYFGLAVALIGLLYKAAMHIYELGLALNVWTVNRAATVRRLARAGVDAVVTDVPDRALSALGRVHAVEGWPPASGALRAAANRAGCSHRVTVEARDLENRPLEPDELAAYDAVVFDPPRIGAKAQAAALARSTVPCIVAVSCNPASFARDARILAAGGYRMISVQPKFP